MENINLNNCSIYGKNNMWRLIVLIKSFWYYNQKKMAHHFVDHNKENSSRVVDLMKNSREKFT